MMGVGDEVDRGKSDGGESESKMTFWSLVCTAGNIQKNQV